MAMVNGRAAASRSFACRSLRRRGRKPRNRKESAGRPETASAVVTAEGPGTDSTLMPFDAQAATSSLPGSLMAGIPASDTRATSPSCSACSTGPSRSRQLWSLKLISLGCASRCASKRRVTRVSSAATSDTDRSTRAARADRSSRFPMGVPTT